MAKKNSHKEIKEDYPDELKPIIMPLPGGIAKDDKYRQRGNANRDFGELMKQRYGENPYERAQKD